MSSAGRPPTDPTGQTRPVVPGGPRGPGRRPDPAVYRRRRLVVGAVLLVVLVGVVLGVSAIARALTGDAAGSAAPTATPTVDPSATPTAGPSGTATATATDAPTRAATPTPAPTYTSGFVPTGCTDDALEVTGSTSSGRYGVGGVITFSVTLRNTGTVPCLFDGGSAALGVVVYSGSDRVWSSTDCPQGSAERPLLLDVDAVENVRIAWSQERSAPGCPAEAALAQPGSYRGVVTLDGGESLDPSWEKVFLIV
jgi:hypothetical protein